MNIEQYAQNTKLNYCRKPSFIQIWSEVDQIHGWSKTNLEVSDDEVIIHELYLEDGAGRYVVLDSEIIRNLKDNCIIKKT